MVQVFLMREREKEKVKELIIVSTVVRRRVHAATDVCVLGVFPCLLFHVHPDNRFVLVIKCGLVEISRFSCHAFYTSHPLLSRHLIMYLHSSVKLLFSCHWFHLR